ncbi:uncharacterized protein LOC133180686 [Saccostrea echinata]|uniref:uncharacterized protein LOC133180686 n=1 Tax=Saccostrea echinata TaxID=191078 RepID=UPI002A82CD42|nr:uncharacterized protein LOC133180686 [Saccostrea echinata]
MGSIFSKRCDIRQCSKCQKSTEFYCNTCKRNLCLKCKERHFFDLDTVNHDVVINQEKCETCETCEIHPDRFYETFCHSCKLPACFQCTEHRNHRLADIITSYKSKRQQHNEIICNIRSETLYNSHCLLAGIKNDIQKSHRGIFNPQSEMSTKAKKIKDLTDTVICDNNKLLITIKCSMIHRLQQQIRNINKHIGSIENFEHNFIKSANRYRPIEFLLFLKKYPCTEYKSIASSLKKTLLSMTEKINKENMIRLLCEIQIIETGQRQVRNECLFKLMSTPVLHKSIEVSVTGAWHISCVNSEQVWISDPSINDCILTNKKGKSLQRLIDISLDTFSYGAHTVNITGDLIYIDKGYNIKKLSYNDRKKFTLIKTKAPWRPFCVYSSPFTADLLVGMMNTDTETGKVNRYNNTGQHIQTIQYGNTGQEMYSEPRYITENRNGDVIVSDFGSDAVVVTEYGGRHRFSYTGHPSGSGLSPLGICTDALSHIIVCGFKTRTVQMIDKNGNFLKIILKGQIDEPLSLCYDWKTHLLWVESWNDKVCIYRYINKHVIDNPTDE